ncbi:MAG: A/G-specific adenine glycosylase [Caulobacteraceae bacterium]
MAAAAPIRKRLLSWYARHGRSLPWRAREGRPDPYRVWLSEVMLQQTTAAHAAPYFLAFTRRWPSLAALAGADDSEVMAAWAGLGYYARARNLLAAARTLRDDFGGSFPRSSEQLRRLPGVGPYSAAAIAAIGFSEAVVAVDANIERVIARLFAIRTPLPAAKTKIRELAGRLLDPHRPGDWTQALMDLGATICQPRAPRCGSCPLKRDCAAFALGLADELPRRAKRSARPLRRGVAYLAERNGAVGLVRRPAKGLLPGMLGLPTTDWRSEPWSAADALADAPFAAPWRDAGSIIHVFTHFRLELDLWRAEAADDVEGLAWTPRGEALAGLPSVFAKAVRLVGKAPSDERRTHL